MIFKNEILSHFNFHHISYCIYFQWTKCEKCDLRLKLDDEEMMKTHNLFHIIQKPRREYSQSKIEFQKGSAKISAAVSPTEKGQNTSKTSKTICELCGENFAGFTLGMYSKESN